jgi:hypothetical protein
LKRIFVLFASLTLIAGCHAQVPVTAWMVSLTCTAPPACTAAAPCTFPVSRLTVASGTASCPNPTGQYVQVGTSAPNSCAYSDLAVTAGLLYCYVAQATQGGATGAASAPSNVVTVPANPAAPGTPTATPEVTTQSAFLIPGTRKQDQCELALLNDATRGKLAGL